MSTDRRTHAEMLPEIRAENEAWRQEYLPKLRARQEQKNADRARATDLVKLGLAAIGATDEDVALVARLSGFIL